MKLLVCMSESFNPFTLIRAMKWKARKHHTRRHDVLNIYGFLFSSKWSVFCFGTNVIWSKIYYGWHSCWLSCGWERVLQFKIFASFRSQTHVLCTEYSLHTEHLRRTALRIYCALTYDQRSLQNMNSVREFVVYSIELISTFILEWVCVYVCVCVCVSVCMSAYNTNGSINKLYYELTSFCWETLRDPSFIRVPVKPFLWDTIRIFTLCQRLIISQF